MRTLEASSKKDPDNNYFNGVIDVLHQVVHESKMYTISYTKEAVADGGTLRVRIVANEKDIHARLAYTGEGKTRLRSYIGTTYTADGTVYTPFNRKTALGSAFGGDIFIDPTINVLGTRRGNDFIGSGGAAAVRVGGTGLADIETIISAGTELLIEIVNNRGSASDLNFIANIYERTAFGD